MRSGTLGLLLGIVLLSWSRELPDTLWLEFLPLALALGLLKPRWRFLAMLAAGLLWALFRAALVMSGSLPPALEGQDLTLQGTIASIPQRFERGVRFELDVDRLKGAGRPWSGPRRVRLSWYDSPPALAVGERWSLTVRLKRPHGYSNPGGFDYERWLFQRGIRATGYVRNRAANHRLAAARGFELARLREHLGERIDQVLAGHEHAGIVKALAVGLRHGLSQADWEVLRATGTSHLMAISGLHIGLVAGLAFYLGRWLWSLPGYTVAHVGAPRVGAVAAILAAVGYAALAGFSIPTQRALVMVAVFMAGILWRGRTAPGHGLFLALSFVLVLDPLSVLSVGFWLSFGAVAVILLGMTGRVSARSLWWRWGRVHWLIAIGLLPLMMTFFGENPLLSPLANLVAVPFMGLLVVPLVLAGVLFLGVLPPMGEWLLTAGANSVELIWPYLEWLAGLDLVYRGPVPDGPWRLAAAIVGAILLLLPRGYPARWLGLLWLSPLVFAPVPRPAHGEAWLTVLDVGQGLGTVVQTRDHVLVFDAGPRFSARFDAGRAVLSPFLRAQGVDRVDTLIVSHGDSDHAGGVASLRRLVPVDSILSSAPERWPGARPCRQGQAWHWDGVQFRILHPRETDTVGSNERSCVLQVRAEGGTALIPADIESPTERALLAQYGEGLRADVLVAPHHGSKTSSSEAFLATVQPRHVMFSVGYRNRFGLPDPEVLARYRQRDTVVHDTARHGAITVKLPGTGVPSVSSHYRADSRRFWNTVHDQSLDAK